MCHLPKLATLAAAVALASACATAPPRSDRARAARAVSNVPYLVSARRDGDKEKLDLYLPAGAGFPTLVSFHGGGLLTGDRSEERFVGERFTREGIAVAVPSYRLSPGVSHPAHVEDAAAAFAWVKRHIAEYGGDADRVFVIGYSAGAYLAALLATDERYLAKVGCSPSDIRGIAPVSAFYWVESVAPDRDKSVWGADPGAWADASPAHHIGARVPPALLVYADGDEPWRRRQNVEMAAALRAAGRPVDVVEVRGRDHETVWRGMSAPDDQVAPRIVDFVRRTTRAM